jgi:arginase
MELEQRMINHNTIHLLGYASGAAGPGPGAGDGPLVLQHSPYLAKLNQLSRELRWDITIHLEQGDQTKLDLVTRLCDLTASHTANLIREKKFFIVLGGDHSSAIGTWSGVSHALSQEGPLGLIWIDAHMDSHTPHTTSTGNYHGMPLACLLGFGETSLINIAVPLPKVRPENICLVGVRSFEPGEAELLQRLQMRIFFMDEVKQRGIAAVLQEAAEIVTKNTVGYGISLDIDSIDPLDAPGTAVVEPDGILGKDLCQALRFFAHDPRLVGAEIVEFDPHRDKVQMTEKLIANLISAITLGQ